MNDNDYDFNKEVDSLYEKIKEEQNLYGYSDTKPTNTGSAILFLLYFFGSIALMIYLFSQEFVHYGLITFGQIFFVFGMIAIKNTKEKEPLLYIFPLVGGALIIIPLLMLYPQLIPVEIPWEALIPTLVLGLFSAIGLGFLIIPLVKERKLKNICTHSIIATVTDYKTTKSDEGNTLYCPIYSFEFGNKTYNVDSNYDTNVGIQEKGSIVDLKIDPMDPETFIDPNKKNKLFTIIFGLVWTIFTLPVFLFLLYELIKRGS